MVKSIICLALVSLQGTNPASKPQGGVQTLGLKVVVARPRRKEEKAHNPALRNRNKCPQKEGPLWTSPGATAGHI